MYIRHVPGDSAGARSRWVAIVANAFPHGRSRADGGADPTEPDRCLAHVNPYGLSPPNALTHGRSVTNANRDCRADAHRSTRGFTHSPRFADGDTRPPTAYRHTVADA